MFWLMYIVGALSITKSFQHQNRFVPIVSEECKKIGVCEDVDNYPEEYVNKIVKKIEERGELWKFEKSDAKINIIENEISTTDKEKSLCKSEMKLITPRAARTGKDDVWQFVINTLDRRLQPILIETCSFDSLDHICGNDVEIDIQAGYNFTCRQKYAFRQTLGLDHNGTVVENRYIFPNCCDCLGSHTHDIMGHIWE